MAKPRSDVTTALTWKEGRRQHAWRLHTKGWTQLRFARWGERPQVAEMGLGKGLSLGAGSRWVGGDTVTGTNGLAPYGQLSLQVFGDPSGRDAIGGVSLTYKQVGFRGGERELEAAFTTTYRSRSIEAGVQVVVGQLLRGGEEHEGELRACVAARVLSNLSLGLTGQVRTAPAEEGGEEKKAGEEARRWDARGGLLASLYVSDVQAGLVGSDGVGARIVPEVLPAFRRNGVRCLGWGSCRAADGATFKWWPDKR